MTVQMSLEDCFQAGWDDGADDAPMTDAEMRKLLPLLSPFLRRPEQVAA